MIRTILMANPFPRPRDRRIPIIAQMDWKTWETQKAGEAKLSVEEGEQYVTELILSRSIALPLRDEKKGYFYAINMSPFSSP